jgi:copper homeostasis protein (lipoprotein)
MRLAQHLLFAVMIFIAVATSCKSKPDTKTEEAPAAIIKGVYVFDNSAKTFIACGQGTQYWATDSTAQLELKYTQLIPAEQLGQPVYIELEGYTMKSAVGTMGEAFDSTLVIKKLITITKDIPADCK